MFVRVTQEIGESFVGGYVYYGRTAANLDTNPFNDNFIRTGADGSIALRKLTVNASLIYGRDDNALGTGERRTFYGGFVEGDCFVKDRAVILVRFDGVHQSQAAVFASADESDGT